MVYFLRPQPIKAIGESQDPQLASRFCLDIKKLPEGNFNKAFLMTMHDGLQVVAKVPNPNTGRPHLTTASEVATMDYARHALGLPVPRVHAWNSRSLTSPVGTEYIIMDKVAGLELSKCWPAMKSDQKLQLLESVIQVEKAFVSSPFPAIGSLYYKEDLDGLPLRTLELDNARSELNERSFVIGPTTSRHFYDYDIGRIEIDRGPWLSAQHYLEALGTGEEKCVEQLGATSYKYGLFGGPGSYKPNTTSKISVLQDYNKIARYLVPNNTSSHSPVLWHGDLHMDNIFVDPSDPTQITGLIDWQATHIAPLFCQAGRPDFLDFNGTKHQEFSLPRLPSNFGKLSPREREDAQDLELKQLLYKYYDIESALQNPPVFDALSFQGTIKYHAIAYAASLLTGGEPRFKGKLIALTDAWEKVVGQYGPACPLHYSEEDRKAQTMEEGLWMMGYNNMLRVLEAIGDAQMGWDGWVEHKHYDAVKERVRDVRQAFLKSIAETEEERRQWAMVWPFGTEEELG
ncbi:MAG: hypothetical protein Q9184_002844 [Pyrenodesmia sp. 2 TL-2023]